MKKKVTISIFLLTLFFFWFSLTSLPKTDDLAILEKPIKEEIEEKIDYIAYINSIRTQYQNNDIVAVLEIPGVFQEIIVQTNDNDYYLHYDIYRNKNIIGASFLDYRNDIRNSKKLLIYGHSDPEGQLPFVQITNFNNSTFFKEHPTLTLTDSYGVRTYEVFSSYIETNDFDYVNLESFNGLTYQEHLTKLQKKSFVPNKTELNEDTNIIILQTCSFDERVKSKTKYQLLIAKEIEK